MTIIVGGLPRIAYYVEPRGDCHSPDVPSDVAGLPVGGRLPSVALPRRVLRNDRGGNKQAKCAPLLFSQNLS